MGECLAPGLVSSFGPVRLVAPAGRPFAEERLLLDRRLETLRRILPDGAATAAKSKRGKTYKLTQAVESVQARCAALEERAVGLRAQVTQHLAAGQRPKAMLALKRAKAIEKQARQAQTTALALESQV